MFSWLPFQFGKQAPTPSTLNAKGACHPIEPDAEPSPYSLGISTWGTSARLFSISSSLKA